MAEQTGGDGPPVQRPRHDLKRAEPAPRRLRSSGGVSMSSSTNSPDASAAVIRSSRSGVLPSSSRRRARLPLATNSARRPRASAASAAHFPSR